MNTTNPATPEAVLLPCPFCGSDPTCDVTEDHSESQSRGDSWMVCCGNGACHGNAYSLDSGFSKREWAVENWNSRVALQQGATPEAGASDEATQLPERWRLLKGGFYYRPNAAGYTAKRYEAGLFTDEVADMHVRSTARSKDPSERVQKELVSSSCGQDRFDMSDEEFRDWLARRDAARDARIAELEGEAATWKRRAVLWKDKCKAIKGAQP